jgi:hypothetical protein
MSALVDFNLWAELLGHYDLPVSTLFSRQDTFVDVYR